MKNKIKALLYCTKAYPYLTRGNSGKVYPSCACSNGILSWHLNGKIVAECEIDKVEEIYHWLTIGFRSTHYLTKTLPCEKLLEKSRLDLNELQNYLEFNMGYALHLTNLKVFDEPKELAKHTLDNNSDFYIKKWIKKFDSFKGSALTKAPQNMCYCYDRFCNEYILISIQPQHLCRILNGEKTVEVRRKVLNCLKEDLNDGY